MAYSPEHGSGGETFSDTIVTLLLMLTIIPAVTQPIEDTLNSLAAGESKHG